jgi:hypothetical protein
LALAESTVVHAVCDDHCCLIHIEEEAVIIKDTKVNTKQLVKAYQ